MKPEKQIHTTNEHRRSQGGAYVQTRNWQKRVKLLSERGLERSNYSKQESVGQERQMCLFKTIGWRRSVRNESSNTSQRLRHARDFGMPWQP